jgi:hypothetical protein
MSAVVNPTYTEFRKDGWPFCPRCGEDELYSHLMLGWTKPEPPPIQDCLDSGMKCYACQWESLGRNVFSGRCWQCHQFIPRAEGEKDYVYCSKCQPLVKTNAQQERIRAEVNAMEWPNLIE